MLAAGLIAVSLWIFDSTLLRTMTDERDRIQRAIAWTDEAIVRLDAETTAITEVELTEEQLRFQQQKELLNRQIEELDSQIANEVADLIPPEAVVSILEDMLAADPSMKLLSLKSQKPYRVGSGKAGSEARESSAPDAQSLYRHRLSIEIAASFPAALAYLQRIESSRWHLLWDRFELNVQEFPETVIRIDLHTLSRQEEWIGV